MKSQVTYSCQFSRSIVTMSSRMIVIVSVLWVFHHGRAEDRQDPVIPEHYNMKILVDVDESRFEGEVNVSIKCLIPTDVVKINAYSMDIDKGKVTVTDADTSEAKTVKSVVIVEEDQLILISLNEKLSENGKYNLHIEFKAKLEDYPAGLYRSYYILNETKHFVANTHFEPYWARLAFPCFDWPHLKATFQFTIGHHERFFALNNMPAIKKEPMEGKTGWVWEHFDKTPIMSTYLVAFAVLDDNIKKTSSGKITWWYPPDVAFPADYTLKVSVDILNYLEDYFGVKYELPKLDMLVVNSYPIFAGACEHWGLIIFVETKFQSEEDTFTIVAHEIIHMWIGNIITMKYYGEMWLKEGVNNYFQYLLGDKIKKSLLTFDGSVSAQLMDATMNFLPAAFSNDDWPKKLTYMSDTFNPQQIYGKGGLLTRMMAMNLGIDNINDSINLMVKKFGYKNHDETDFFNTLKELTPAGNFPENLDIVEVFKSWSKQGLFPVVEVERNSKNGQVTLNQIPNPKKVEKEACWWIPISHTTKTEKRFDNVVPKNWMTCPNTSLVLNDIKPEDWILINLQSASYFVTKYDLNNWNLLTETLNDPKNFEVIPFWNRFKLILDVDYLSHFDLFPHEAILNTLLYLKHEKNHIVWDAANQYLKKLSWIHEIIELKREYMKIIVSPHFSKKLFVEKDTTEQEKRYRNTIITEACDSGIVECLNETFIIFNEFKCTHPNTKMDNKARRYATFCVVFKRFSKRNQQFLINLSRKVTDPGLFKDIKKSKIDCYEGGENVEDLRSIQKISDNLLVMKSSHSGMKMSEFQKETDSFGLLFEIRALALKLHSSSFIDFYKNEFKDSQYNAFKKDTTQIIERIQTNIDWTKKYAKDIKMALQSILQRQKNVLEKIPS